MNVLTVHGYVNLDVIRSSRRTSQFSVFPGGRVVLRVPLRTGEDRVFDLVQKKSSWIVKVRERLALRKVEPLSDKPYDGACFYVFGQKKIFRIFSSTNARLFFEDSDDGWALYLPDDLGIDRREHEARRVLALWADKKILDYLSGRMVFWCRQMGLRLPVMNVRCQRRLWGSCNVRDRKLSFNRSLLACPVDIVDYVVVHELCHLTFADHSVRFWNEVSKWCPDFLEKRRWLKEEAHQYRSP